MTSTKIANFDTINYTINRSREYFYEVITVAEADDKIILTHLFQLTENLGRAESSLQATTKTLDETLKRLETVVLGQERVLSKQEAQTLELQEVGRKNEEYFNQNKQKIQQANDEIHKMKAEIAELKTSVEGLEKIEAQKMTIASENVKGKWAFFAAAGTALISAIAAILVAIFK